MRVNYTVHIANNAHLEFCFFFLSIFICKMRHRINEYCKVLECKWIANAMNSGILSWIPTGDNYTSVMFMGGAQD